MRSSVTVLGGCSCKVEVGYPKCNSRNLRNLMRVQKTEASPACTTLEEVLEELGRVAPTAPFLALGQTVLWDEPMKAGVALAAQALGKGRKLVGGVHDTDYFAKLPNAKRGD